MGESQAGEMFAWGRKRESRIDEQARPCAPLLSLSLSLLVAGVEIWIAACAWRVGSGVATG